jgi:hypothetical protein
MFPDHTGSPEMPAPKGNRWIEGFAAAEKQFMAADTPDYVNPYPEGDPAHDGYEEAVYIFTQK